VSPTDAGKHKAGGGQQPPPAMYGSDLRRERGDHVGRLCDFAKKPE